MCIVALCAAGLALSGAPISVLIFFAALGVAVYTCMSLARHGFKLSDIATLLAIVLLTAAIILPAMERTRSRTLGARFFPLSFPPDTSPCFMAQNEVRPFARTTECHQSTNSDLSRSFLAWLIRLW
jgi:hypothetical protein